MFQPCVLGLSLAHTKTQNHSPSEDGSEERGSCMKHSAKVLLVEAGAGRRAERQEGIQGPCREQQVSKGKNGLRRRK